MEAATPELFSCAKVKMKLTPRGCANLYLSALREPPKPWTGSFACLRCPIGAKNAGHSVPSPAAQQAADLRTICPRCLRGSFRMVYPHGSSALCISCYNRNREFSAGRNAKGTAPTLKLHAESIVVVADGVARRVERQRVSGPAEVMVSMARVTQVPMSFGWGRSHAA